MSRVEYASVGQSGPKSVAGECSSPSGGIVGDHGGREPVDAVVSEYEAADAAAGVWSTRPRGRSREADA